MKVLVADKFEQSGIDGLKRAGFEHRRSNGRAAHDKNLCPCPCDRIAERVVLQVRLEDDLAT